MARRSALDHEHRRDVAERLALEHLPAEESAGIKAQIAPKEEEIDQLRQAVAGLREKAGRARGRRKRADVFRQVGVSCLVMYFFRVGAGAVLLDSSLIPSPPIMPQDRARVDDP